VSSNWYVPSSLIRKTVELNQVPSTSTSSFGGGTHVPTCPAGRSLSLRIVVGTGAGANDEHADANSATATITPQALIDV